jgi:predicted nucleic acid-binding protein
VKTQGILLDTNVLSELMRAEPDAGVLTWFERQHDAVLYTTAITRAEILLGIALLPAGKRRESLATVTERMFEQDFARHCLPFDQVAAAEYALLVAARIRIGRPISTEDGQIAAIALRHDMRLATRNGRDFEGIAGLVVLNPWRS